jgi:hypothetical protein
LPPERSGKWKANGDRLVAPIQKLHDEITGSVLDIGLIGVRRGESDTHLPVCFRHISPVCKDA